MVYSINLTSEADESDPHFSQLRPFQLFIDWDVLPSNDITVCVVSDPSAKRSWTHRDNMHEGCLQW